MTEINYVMNNILNVKIFLQVKSMAVISINRTTVKKSTKRFLKIEKCTLVHFSEKKVHTLKKG